MILPPARLPAVAPVPISAPPSAPHRAGAAARQVSGVPTNRPLASRPVISEEHPTRTNTNSQLRGAASASDETESADSSAGESTPEQAFADIIRQLSFVASAPAVQTAVPNGSQNLPRGWQVAGSGLTAVIPAAPVPAPTASLPTTTATPATGKKQPAANTPRSADTLPKDHTQDIRPVPVDVAALLPPLKPKLAELASSGGVVNVQLKPQAAHPVALRPEAALTVVIHPSDPAPVVPPTGNETATAQPDAAARTPQYSPNQPEAVVPVAAPAVKTDNTSTAAIAPLVNTAQVTSDEAVTPVSAPSVRADVEPRKGTAGETAAAPDIVARSTGPQTGAFQDLQLKAEPGKNDSATPRPAAQTAPAAPPERAMPDKSNTPPVKSVALEFTPDGTRDVKVRLSERGGEVHVSVHSTDPAVTKDLRAGVTDLASVLEHAGYDAKAWAGDRQQQGNPQQQEEQTPQRRNNRSGDDAQQFDSILQQPNQENS